MGPEERKPDPISMGICLLAAVGVLVASLVFLPAAELLPAQVFPEKRGSGESCVRIPELMNQYAGFGVQMLGMLPGPKPAADAQNADVMKDWKAKIVETNGDKYGDQVAKDIQQNLGEQNLKTVLDLLQVDKNYVYNAYALFLGLALFLGAVAIQAMGRWGAEEKTILPVKK